MGLENRSGGQQYVNIKAGQLYTKEKSGEAKFFTGISGTITGIAFKKDEYNGKKFEVAQISMNDGQESFLVQMRTDSGYFRGFCNSLKTGNPTEPVSIAPDYKKEGDDKPTTTCFIRQNNIPLKWYSTKDHPMDLPPLEKVTFREEELWDSSKQMKYWKDWLLSIKWKHEILAGPVNAPINNTDETAADDLPF